LLEFGQIGTVFPGARKGHNVKHRLALWPAIEKRCA